MSYTYNKIVNAGNVNINENYVKKVSNMPVLQQQGIGLQQMEKELTLDILATKKTKKLPDF